MLNGDRKFKSILCGQYSKNLFFHVEKNLFLLLKKEEGKRALKITLGLWKSIVCQYQTWYLLESIFNHVQYFSIAT